MRHKRTRIRPPVGSLIRRAIKKATNISHLKECKMTEQCTASLPEPSDVRHTCASERIAMLLMHMDYGPSAKWIRDVLLAAADELRVDK